MRLQTSAGRLWAHRVGRGVIWETRFPIPQSHKGVVMANERSDSTRWNHANPILEVSNVPRAIAFYRDVGLTPSWMWEETVGGVHTDHGSIEIYLSRAERPSPSRLAVFVDDADATYERYRAAGAEIVDELKTQPWGLRGFTVRDPDGNLVGIAHEVHGPSAQSGYQDLTGSPPLQAQ
jgi:catechol 2,3-dioxygenase-like lactoylglutathione lyase family enzyme